MKEAQITITTDEIVEALIEVGDQLAAAHGNRTLLLDYDAQGALMEVVLAVLADNYTNEASKYVSREYLDRIRDRHSAPSILPALTEYGF